MADANNGSVKQVIHYLHIGKTGGTAIKHALSQHPADSSHTVQLHTHHTKLRDIPVGERVIFFLREPISRFVSGFFSRQRQGQPRIFKAWTDDEKRAFERFRTPNDLAMALTSPNTPIKETAIRAMKAIGHVRTSYWDWFENEAYLQSRLSDIFFIGFQETLTADFEILKAKLGSPKQMLLPQDETQAHKNPEGLNKALTEQASQNLKEWYRRDYEFISLCQQIIQDHPQLRDASSMM